VVASGVVAKVDELGEAKVAEAQAVAKIEVALGEVAEEPKACRH